VSIRRRALDLVYSMCDYTNCRETIAELVSYLALADYNLREELVLKVGRHAEHAAMLIRRTGADCQLRGRAGQRPPSPQPSAIGGDGVHSRLRVLPPSRARALASFPAHSRTHPAALL
jgi:hypothetical protein